MNIGIMSLLWFICVMYEYWHYVIIVVYWFRFSYYVVFNLLISATRRVFFVSLFSPVLSSKLLLYIEYLCSACASTEYS